MRRIGVVGNWWEALCLRGLTELALAGLALHGTLYRGECYLRQLGGFLRVLAYRSTQAIEASAPGGRRMHPSATTCASTETATN